MKPKRIITLILALVTVLSVFSMTSCLSMGGMLGGTSGSGYITKDEVDNLLSQIRGNGDTYNVDITSTECENVLSASKAVLSVVSVYCDFQTRGSMLQPSKKISTAGSGVIYKLDKASGDAYIITNYHVVYSEDSTTSDGISDSISLYLYGQENSDYAIPATYVGGSMSYDLAVLKVDNSWVLKNSNAAAATVADSNDVALLETVIAIGNPESLGISATAGYISVDSEYIDILMKTLAGQSKYIELRVMRVDAAVNSGNSGGGLFNASGELVGIVNAKIADTSVENIGYAIPSNVAVAVAENIMYYADKKDVPCVYNCSIGITVIADASYTEYDTETGKVHKKEDVEITEINTGSFAYGKLEEGDIIRKVTVDGKEHEVVRMYSVIDSMLSARVGSSIVFSIERDGSVMDVSVVIDDGSTLTAAA